MSQRITVMVRYKVKEGMEQKFKELFLPFIELSRSDEGCIAYELHQAINDPALFVLYEIWGSRELLNEHAATPHVQNFRSKAKDLLTGAPELTLLAKIGS